MKKILFAAMLIVTSFAFGQNCKSFYYLQNNKTIEMTFFNKKNEPDGKQVFTVSDVKTAAGTTTGHISSELFDKKGKSIAKGESMIKCNGGVFMVDLKMNLPQQSQSATGKLENAYIEYPASMIVGDVLKDGTMDLETDKDGMKQSTKIEITNRKVEGKESITTTAGTWECFKITYKSKITTKVMSIGIPIKMDVIEWYAPGFGVVKTEAKGRTTAITSIK